MVLEIRYAKIEQHIIRSSNLIHLFHLYRQEHTVISASVKTPLIGISIFYKSALSPPTLIISW
jgi:hypothetical protein